MKTRGDLITYIKSENDVKYLFFWGHQRSKKSISKSCLSQWYESSFEENGNVFKTAEHYMMYEKAKIFGDIVAMGKALIAKSPREVKSIGRSVNNFDDSVWNRHKFDLVVRANHAKFKSNNEIKSFLVNSGNRVLVEASPVDKVWGIGLAEDDEAAQNPNLWKGENLLGFALMEVRKQLEKEGSN